MLACWIRRVLICVTATAASAAAVQCFYFRSLAIAPMHCVMGWMPCRRSSVMRCSVREVRAISRARGVEPGAASELVARLRGPVVIDQKYSLGFQPIILWAFNQAYEQLCVSIARWRRKP